MYTFKHIAFYACFSIILFCLGCSEKASDESAPVGLRVTQEEFGDRWIFTVESGYVYSLANGSAIFRTGDTKYGLNGRAIGYGYKDIHQIWKKETIFQDIRNRDGSNIEAYKGSASSFIELANQHRVR